MTDTAPGSPLPDARAPLAAHLRNRTPGVFRGLAAGWPAVNRWTLRHIGSLGPDLPVELVDGDRESDRTRFVPSTLGAYVDHLEQRGQEASEQLYLKEFDLLAAFPALRADLLHEDLFPTGTIVSSSAWLGPTGARTGLHHDLLDNVAVQVLGTKRFVLAAPGTVERAGAVSGKYDRWARLSTAKASELSDVAAAQDCVVHVTLHPGDVLYVPASWWHEVTNISTSLLLSGFFGPRALVLKRWAGVQLRHGLHRAGLVGRGDCTCHPAAPVDHWWTAHRGAPRRR